ncbi:hypothetical protein N9L68_09220 [bacterium]|nr:hypothetical protein [bacterium]
MAATMNLQSFLRQGVLSLVPTQAQAEEEAHLLALRRGQTAGEGTKGSPGMRLAAEVEPGLVRRVSLTLRGLLR